MPLTARLDLSGAFIHFFALHLLILCMIEDVGRHFTALQDVALRQLNKGGLKGALKIATLIKSFNFNTIRMELERVKGIEPSS